MIYTNQTIKDLQKDYKSKIMELCGEYFEQVVDMFYNDNTIIEFDVLYIDPITNIKYQFSKDDIEIEFDIIKNIDKFNPHSYSFVSCHEKSEGYVDDYIIGRLIKYKEEN